MLAAPWLPGAAAEQWHGVPAGVSAGGDGQEGAGLGFEGEGDAEAQVFAEVCAEGPAGGRKPWSPAVAHADGGEVLKPSQPGGLRTHSSSRMLQVAAAATAGALEPGAEAELPPWWPGGDMARRAAQAAAGRGGQGLGADTDAALPAVERGAQHGSGDHERGGVHGAGEAGVTTPDVRESGQAAGDATEAVASAGRFFCDERLDDPYGESEGDEGAARRWGAAVATHAAVEGLAGAAAARSTEGVGAALGAAAAALAARLPRHISAFGESSREESGPLGGLQLPSRITVFGGGDDSLAASDGDGGPGKGRGGAGGGLHRLALMGSAARMGRVGGPGNGDADGEAEGAMGGAAAGFLVGGSGGSLLLGDSRLCITQEWGAGPPAGQSGELLAGPGGADGAGGSVGSEGRQGGRLGGGVALWAVGLAGLRRSPLDLGGGQGLGGPCEDGEGGEGSGDGANPLQVRGVRWGGRCGEGGRLGGGWQDSSVVLRWGRPGADGRAVPLVPPL
jgi:hypothetical protein